MSDRFYITTTLPYVNARPHMGHALEFVQADAIARYRRLRGQEVFFNIGTDEHGQKIWQKAREEGKSPKEYADFFAGEFRSFADSLNISYTHFIRTTDEHHVRAAREFWRIVSENGDIYKKNYRVKYCVGCELEKTDSELEDGRCPVHPSVPLEVREEENYFFRFSRYGEKLLALYENRPDFVLPEARMNEIRSFVARGLSDFSISRLKEKMPWGVPVPGDDRHVMYVWFDALVNYIAAIGWPDDKDEFAKWWPVVQIAGKDNLRQQAAMWQAMLFSAGLPPSEKILIHGFVLSGGRKMSKSLGNVVDPADIVGAYGADALRYYLLREMPVFEDGEFTESAFLSAYNANLANGIGNLASRVMKMAETHLSAPVETGEKTVDDFPEFRDAMDSYALQKGADIVWERIGALDGRIQEEKPFALVKTDAARARENIADMVRDLSDIAFLLSPFLPETAENIRAAIAANRKPPALFERKEMR